MEFLEVLIKRCSMRAYEDRKVDPELMKRVIMAADTAPVGLGLYENIHLTIVTNEALLEKIDRAAAKKMGKEDAHPIYGVPALIVVSSCPGKFVIPGIKELNCGCIIENMMLACTDNGLGSVFLLAATEAMAADAEIMTELNIPEGYTPVGAMGFGYPAAEIKIKDRVSRIAVNTVE